MIKLLNKLNRATRAANTFEEALRDELNKNKHLRNKVSSLNKIIEKQNLEIRELKRTFEKKLL